ncbi:permease [Halioglobus sp. HI00S01]|nr:permease [Halioglobus sp. HI00S01]
MTFDMQMLQEAIHMFLFLSVELTLLYLIISYGVGLLQHHLGPERIQSILASRGGRGYFIAALLGAITPFCSCSTIPFLKGLLRAQAGFGTMMVFLFASPLLNPIIIGLFVVTFGIKVATTYFAIAMVSSIMAGIVLEKRGFERYIKAEAYMAPQASGCSASCGAQQVVPSKWRLIWDATWADFKKVLPYLAGGIAVGSFIYGFMPSDLVASVASEDNPWAIPVAAVIGIPLYIRAEAVIPLSAALAAKGMGLGAVMALIIGSAGASLTEVILLKSLFRNALVAAFVAVILSMAIGAGFFYQWAF